MKKLHILGRFKNTGRSRDDSHLLEEYMELGWELFTTGLWAKVNLGSDDYICTARDRLFMYSHITDNLIPWEALWRIGLDEYHINNVWEPQTRDGLLRKYSSDWSYKLIECIQKNNIPVLSHNAEFVCIQIRHRDHCPERNGYLDEWYQALNILSTKYEKVYLVGKLPPGQQLPENVELVNLDKYCSLIKSPKCVASIGPSSGCMLLNYIYGRKGLPVKIHMSDWEERERQSSRGDLSGHSLLYFADQGNVAEVDRELFPPSSHDYKAVIEVVEGL